MKYVLTIVLLLYLSTAFSQSSDENVLLQTKRKYFRYYVELGPTEGWVYGIGNIMDPGGGGYYLYNTDTVYKQSDGTYTNKKLRIIPEKNKIYLDVKDIKVKRHRIDTVENLAEGFININNGYYLKNFFDLSDTLNKIYPLNHYSFRNGFYTWKDLKNKEMEPGQFRLFADARLNELKDSICQLQDVYVSLTNTLIHNLTTLDYYTLKNSLAGLPADYRGKSWYFGSVAKELAKQRPDFFFRIADEMSYARDILFAAVEKDEQVIQGLRAVKDQDDIKEEFFSWKGWKYK